MEYLVHVAYVLFLLSYLVRDILWLRAITVAGSLALLPYYHFRDQPLVEPFCWSLAFAIINAVQISLLIAERRPVKFNDEQRRLYRLVFRSLRPREFLHVLARATWNQIDADEVLVEVGDALDRLMLIFSGRVRVELHDGNSAHLTEGQFVGEIALLTEGVSVHRVVAVEPTRYVVWSADDLNHFLQKHPDLWAHFEIIIGKDVIKKLGR